MRAEYLVVSVLCAPRPRRIDFVRWAWFALMANQFSEQNPPADAQGTPILEFYSISPGRQWEYFALLFPFFAAYALLVRRAPAFACVPAGGVQPTVNITCAVRALRRAGVPGAGVCAPRRALIHGCRGPPVYSVCMQSRTCSGLTDLAEPTSPLLLLACELHIAVFTDLHAAPCVQGCDSFPAFPAFKHFALMPW